MYLFFTRIRIISHLAYSFDVVMSIILRLFVLLVMIFIWKSAYRGIDARAMITEQHMITYTIISVLMGSIVQCQVQDIIRYRVVNGEIAIDLFRPVNPLICWLFDDFGSSINAFALTALPILSIALVFRVSPFPVSFAAFGLFLCSLLLSYALLWLLSALVGLTAFWVMELGNMGMVKDMILSIVSGSFVPIWFFPTWYQNISPYLPFQYTYQTPLALYIGKLSVHDAFPAMLIQSAWIVVCILILAAVWSRARKHVLVQGG